jgi:hypothetical protein
MFRNPRRLLSTAFLLGCCLLVFDYWRFEGDARQIITVTSQLGGRAGSIGGWPWGREFALSFDAELSEQQLQLLDAAVADSSRIHVSAYFPASDVDLARLRRVVKQPNLVVRSKVDSP